MKFFSAYDRPKVDGVFFDPEVEPSKTVQSQAEEADINTIVKRFGLTGQLPVNVRVPTYGDFGEDVFDFQSAMNAVRQAQESFMAMPADVRARFHNDPQEFLEFCTEEKDGKLANIDEMRKLGLAVPVEVVVESPPTKVEIVNSEVLNGNVKDGVAGGSKAS